MARDELMLVGGVVLKFGAALLVLEGLFWTAVAGHSVFNGTILSNCGLYDAGDEGTASVEYVLDAVRCAHQHPTACLGGTANRCVYIGAA
jgi:hypothetical protein